MAERKNRGPTASFASPYPLSPLFPLVASNETLSRHIQFVCMSALSLQGSPVLLDSLAVRCRRLIWSSSPRRILDGAFIFSCLKNILSDRGKMAHPALFLSFFSVKRITSPLTPSTELKNALIGVLVFDRRFPTTNKFHFFSF